MGTKGIKRILKPVKFFSTLGIEFTWVNTLLPDITDTTTSGAKFVLLGYFNKSKCKVIRNIKVLDDEGALEIPSPIFKQWDQVENFYTYIKSIVEQAFPLLNFKDHANNKMSGGGHIHIGIPKKALNNSTLLFSFLLNVVRDITNRPYLNWIFNEWSDCYSAQNVLIFEDNVEYLFKKESFSKLKYFCVKKFRSEYSWLSHFSEDNIIFKLFGFGKGNDVIVNNIYKTVELRFFDMVRNEKDLLAHVNFANAYIKNIYELTLNGVEIPSVVKGKMDIKRFVHRDLGILEFKKLIKAIGLDYRDYEQFINMNYKKRKKHGEWI